MGIGFMKMWVLAGLLLLNLLGVAVIAAPQVPCYFIFGDSLVDNGNNNRMASIARANYRPYGIDFPQGPTGRFCNGKTTVDVISNYRPSGIDFPQDPTGRLCNGKTTVDVISNYRPYAIDFPQGPTGRFCNGKTTVDVISQLLGFDKYIPPYSNVSGRDILTGVNYASAAAGIREETGQQLGARISMSMQVANYRTTVQQVVRILGSEGSAANYLRKCIYSVGMGSNDYLNNYFMPLYYSSSRQYTPEQFANVLIQQYTQQLRSLYNYGARKVAVIGVGQVGCSPSELAMFSANGSGCVTRINNAIVLFNNKIRSLVDDFNKNLSGAKFTYINGFGIFGDVLQNARSNGFTVTNRGCCGVGRNNGQITCLPLQTPCPNRRQYIFWDAFHPTEAFNEIFARRSYSCQSSSDAHPFDIKHLAQQ